MIDEKFICPFTGQKFHGTIENDGSITILNPITKAIYNFKVHGNAITIPLELFEYVDMVNGSQAAKILNISHQRISELAKNDRIPYTLINGVKMFRRDDIMRYKNSRKNGRPRKE